MAHKATYIGKVMLKRVPPNYLSECCVLLLAGTKVCLEKLLNFAYLQRWKTPGVQ